MSTQDAQNILLNSLHAAMMRIKKAVRFSFQTASTGTFRRIRGGTTQDHNISGINSCLVHRNKLAVSFYYLEHNS